MLSGPELSLAVLKEQEPVGCQEGTWHSRPRGSMSKRRGKSSMGNSGSGAAMTRKRGVGSLGGDSAYLVQVSPRGKI